METLATGTFFFGEFQINAEKRLLTKRGEIINLNPKAFDLLLFLVGNRGKILSKNELLDTIWAEQFVEENNLTVHVSALRKIFGEKKGENRFIVTIPGRGYTFVADVRRGANEEVKATTAGSGHSAMQLTIGDGQNSSLLVGREREITQIKSLLRRDGVNLVTLTGAGGTGKTRLAQKVSEELSAEFSDGVFFTDLAAITGAQLVVPAIAQTFDLKETGEKLPIETLKNFLHRRQLLLVLDNFEQLISAAPLIREINDAALHLKLLVTSRIALGLKNENEFVVAPLALPPPDFSFSRDDLTGYPAISLFIARARAVKPNFELTNENAVAVAGICQKLDGLPLAIELAAARTKLLSPASILNRLENSLNLLTGGARDLPARQQTMRAAVKWSYDLLEADEKKLFRRLAVFAGGFTVEAAEAVVEGVTEKKIEASNEKIETGEMQITATQPLCVPESQINVLDGITSLLDKNLLAAKEQPNADARLRMLEVVREFALEELEAHGEAEIMRRNHARFFLALGETAEPFLMVEQSVEWLEKLETEIDNLRAALSWSLRSDAETGVRLAAATRQFWIFRSHLTEGRGWLNAALAQSDNANTELGFNLLYALGVMSRLQGDYSSALMMYQQALDKGKASGDRRQIAFSSNGMGTILQLQGDAAAARKYFEQGLAVSREMEDDYTIAYSLLCLGIVLGMERKPAEARRLLEESLTILRKFGSKEAISNALNNLGGVAFDEGDYDAAQSYFTEGLATAQEVGNKVNITDSLNGLAAFALQRGEPELAARLAGAAEDLGESIGFNKEPAERLFCETYIAKARAALGEQTFAAEFEKGRAMGWSKAAALAVRKPESSSDRSETNEIIIESHKFERIIIEEEIENASDKPELLPARSLNRAKVPGASDSGTGKRRN